MDEENMPGMQHGRTPDSGEQDMPGMQHGGAKTNDQKPTKDADQGMPGMEHDALPGMQHGSSRKPTTEKPDQAGHAGMPGMEHGPQAPKEGKRPGISSEENAGKHGAQQSPKPIYTCPMHREVKSDKPDRCPICGMKLEPESSGGTP